ncbi:beta-lactamase family protein [Micromonospora sp. CPCC 205371]|nr:beta-lactamase family protein [Micromonospora sp. CPCC 205371]
MLRETCLEIDRELRSRPEFAHTSHFRLVVGGEVVHDAHYGGPAVADVFSVTKSVVATLAGIAVRDGLLPSLDVPVERVLPEVAGTPSAGQTLRHLLTMTRGSDTGGQYEIDEVMALRTRWVARIAAAPRIAAPGARFQYDDGGAHLFGAALSRLVGDSLSGYAGRALFAPLGVTDWHWPADPDGLNYGFGHLRLSAASLASLGALWLDNGRSIMDPGFAREMTTTQTGGGPPEGRAYGYFMWVDEHGYFAGGWAGQHVTVLPADRAIVVTTGDPRFDPGPPPTHHLPRDWRPARDLVLQRLLPMSRYSLGR